MAVFFKVLSCPTPLELFAGIRSFRIHELSPPDSLYLYWKAFDRTFFPFRPRPAVWYHRPNAVAGSTGRLRLIAHCDHAQHTQLVVEVR